MRIKGGDAYKALSSAAPNQWPQKASYQEYDNLFLQLLLFTTVIISYPHSFPLQNKLHHNKICIFLILSWAHFRERGREGEKHQCEQETGDWTCNLGMCPDQELNLGPFGLWDDTQPTEPHRPEQDVNFHYWHLIVKQSFLRSGLQSTLQFPLFLIPGILFVWTWIVWNSLFSKLSFVFFLWHPALKQ